MKNPEEKIHVITCGKTKVIFITCKGIGDYADDYLLCELDGSVITSYKTKEERNSHCYKYGMQQLALAGEIVSVEA